MNPDRMRDSIVLAAAASMMSVAAAYDDGAGKSWRQLTESQVLSWSQVAAVCPLGGVAPCNGRVGDVDFKGWTWATQQQVMDLFNRVLPEDPKRPNRGKLSIDHPGIGAGVAYFGLADHFLSNAFAPTSSFCLNYDCGESVIGWTASRSRNGKAILGAVAWYRTPEKLDGDFSVGRVHVTNDVQPEYGVWLWRPIAGVPEPTTAWLLAGGGLALLLRRRFGRRPAPHAPEMLRALEFYGRARAARQNAPDRGAMRSHSSGYGEHLQRRAGVFWRDERA